MKSHARSWPHQSNRMIQKKQFNNYNIRHLTDNHRIGNRFSCIYVKIRIKMCSKQQQKRISIETKFEENFFSICFSFDLNLAINLNENQNEKKNIVWYFNFARHERFCQSTAKCGLAWNQSMEREKKILFNVKEASSNWKKNTMKNYRKIIWKGASHSMSRCILLDTFHL